MEGYGFIGKDLLFNMFKAVGKKNDVAFMMWVRYLQFWGMLEARHLHFLQALSGSRYYKDVKKLLGLMRLFVWLLRKGD